MPFGFPALLELAGRRVVVIGVDAVREHRVRQLLESGATDITLIVEGDVDVAETPDDRVRVERRAWRPSDLDGAFLCLAASRDAGERAELGTAARERGVLVNVTDDIPQCDFAMPAIVRRGELVLAIGTGGGSPTLARKLREELGDRFGPEWEEILRVLREVREETIDALPDLADRSRRWRRALDLEEAQKLVAAGRPDELADRLRTRLLADREESL
ncbi:MAG: bifunctional precorrin-2 dehydrogenase/sirohydrochlorin ferrochelatase [Actinomycetota bacterium]